MPLFSHVLMTGGIVIWLVLAVFYATKALALRDALAVMLCAFCVVCGSVFASELHYLSGHVKAWLLWGDLVLGIGALGQAYHHESQRRG